VLEIEDLEATKSCARSCCHTSSGRLLVPASALAPARESVARMLPLTDAFDARDRLAN
jgi:hypothetical protein